ncbi:hypothetical protein TKK_0019105 [Trichogramma kaykai]
MRGWGDKKRSYSNVVQLFNVTFREAGPNISKATVSKTIRRFERTGSIKNHYHVGRPVSVTNEERSLDVMLSFIENPHQSTRQASLQHEMDPKSVQFCEEMMAFITQIPRFLKNIVFSDEATFQLNGNVNRQNCRYWSDVNPHWMVEGHTQYPQKLNVWAGIINDTIIGPFFIEGNLNATSYEHMLRTQIVPAIRALKGEEFEFTWFQQDGASPHYGVRVRNYLNDVFFERWIGRRGTIE